MGIGLRHKPQSMVAALVCAESSPLTSVEMTTPGWGALTMDCSDPERMLEWLSDPAQPHPGHWAGEMPAITGISPPSITESP